MICRENHCSNNIYRYAAKCYKIHFDAFHLLIKLNSIWKSIDHIYMYCMNKQTKIRINLDAILFKSI